MAMAMTFEEAKTNPLQFRRAGDDKHTTAAVWNVPFFSFPDNPEMPHATFNQNDPGRYSSSHFHTSDGFHIVAGGRGKIGRHDLLPLTVHFARAYTPYGPLVADEQEGLSLFVLRAHRDTGSQRLPAKRAVLDKVASRRPWQLVQPTTFPNEKEQTNDVMLEPLPDMKDEYGLAAYTLRLKPNCATQAPDPSNGDGQYVVAVEGSFVHEGRDYEAPAIVFINPDESAFEVRSGSSGLKAIILNFPLPQSKDAIRHKRASSADGLKAWQCDLCSFVFDEATGVAGEGIAPGTRWQDLPEDWSCPDCGASKDSFQLIQP